MQTRDVVIVGGGIAGSAIAAALAPAGVDVLVIERQVKYRDRVRGEYLQPWGVAEARRLGVEQTLLDAGGGYTTRLATYGEDVDADVAASVARSPRHAHPGRTRWAERRAPAGIGGAQFAGRRTRRHVVARRR